MASTFPLGVVFTAADRGLLATLGKAENRVVALGRRLTALGRGLTLGVTAPIVAFAGTSIHAASSLQDQLIRTQVVTRATGEEIDKLKGQALDLGAESIFAANQVAEAQGKLALAGFKVNQVLDATPGVVNLAAASWGDLATSAGIVTEVLKGYRLEASESGRVANLLAGGASRAKVTVEELGEAFSYAAGLARASDAPIEDTTALLALLAEAGFAGSRGGRALAASYAAVLKVTPEAARALSALKISRDQVLTDDGKVRDFIGLLELLRSRGATSTDVLRIFGQEAGRAILQLVTRTDDLRAFARGLGDEDEKGLGRAAEIAQARMQGASGALENLSGAWETLRIRVAERSGLLETWTSGLRNLTGVVDRLGNTSPGTLKFLTTVGLVVSAVGPFLFSLGAGVQGLGALGGALKKLGPVLRWVAFTGVPGLLKGLNGVLLFLLANPVGNVLLLAGALTALGVVIYRHWDGIEEYLRDKWRRIGEFSDGLVAKLNSAAESIAGPSTAFALRNRLVSGLGLAGDGRPDPRRVNDEDSLRALGITSRRPVGAGAGSPLAAPSSTVRIELPNLPPGSRVRRYDFGGGAPVDLSAGTSLAGVGIGG